LQAEGGSAEAELTDVELSGRPDLRSPSMNRSRPMRGHATVGERTDAKPKAEILDRLGIIMHV